MGWLGAAKAPRFTTDLQTWHHHVLVHLFGLRCVPGKLCSRFGIFLCSSSRWCLPNVLEHLACSMTSVLSSVYPWSEKWRNHEKPVWFYLTSGPVSQRRAPPSIEAAHIYILNGRRWITEKHMGIQCWKGFGGIQHLGGMNWALRSLGIWYVCLCEKV